MVNFTSPLILPALKAATKDEDEKVCASAVNGLEKIREEHLEAD